jgi:hypothetical protein
LTTIQLNGARLDDNFTDGPRPGWLSKMEGAVAWLEARAREAQSFKPAVNGINGTRDIFQLAGSSGGQNQSQAAIINEFRFAAAKSIRTSTIILAAFNAIAAFTTAFGILYECYTARKRNRRRYSTR